MTSGKLASILFGIREPTEVLLTFHEKYKCFTLTTANHVTTTDETEEDLDETIKPFENNTYTLHPYNNDQIFGWEQKVTKAYV
jgi:hypothetical protein